MYGSPPSQASIFFSAGGIHSADTHLHSHGTNFHSVHHVHPGWPITYIPNTVLVFTCRTGSRSQSGMEIPPGPCECHILVHGITRTTTY